MAFQVSALEGFVLSPDLRDLIGVPFVGGGRDPKKGLDCWGLLVIAAGRYGHVVPNYEIDCHDTERIEKQVLSDIGGWEKIEEPEPGCVVLMNLDPEMPDAIQHFGVYIGGGRFLHTLKKTGSCRSSIHDRFWTNKVRGYLAWKQR